MALLRGAAAYFWRSDAPDRLIPVVPPSDALAAATAPPAGTAARAPAAGIAGGRYFRSIQMAPRGDRIYLIDHLNRLQAWDIAGSSADAELHASRPGRVFPAINEISNIALRPDGMLLAAADRSGNITLIDTERNVVRGSIRPAGDDGGTVFAAPAFSPDGKLLAVGSPQGTIALYSVGSPARPRLRLRLPGHPRMVNSLKFDPAGSRLASAAFADPPVVEIWDLDLIGRELKGLDLADDSR
jgi:WD40 repeat protein